MSAAAIDPAQQQPQTGRQVDYVDPAVAAMLTGAVRHLWPDERSCQPFAAVAGSLPPLESERLVARATAFADDVASWIKADVLPEPLEEAILVGPDGLLYVSGARVHLKIRVDEDMNVALVRLRPRELEGPRQLSLRAELRDLFTFPLASMDKKPVAALTQLDLSDRAEPGSFYAELDAPAGLGYLGGRAERLRAFSDGKVLLAAFQMIVDLSGVPPEMRALPSPGAGGTPRKGRWLGDTGGKGGAVTEAPLPRAEGAGAEGAQASEGAQAPQGAQAPAEGDPAEGAGDDEGRSGGLSDAEKALQEPGVVPYMAPDEDWPDEVKEGTFTVGDHVVHVGPGTEAGGGRRARK